MDGINTITYPHGLAALPVNEVTSYAILEQKLKKELLSFRRCFWRNRIWPVVHGNRVNAVCIESGHDGMVGVVEQTASERSTRRARKVSLGQAIARFCD